MLGRALDIRLLRLMAHDRNSKTEEQILLEARAVAAQASHEISEEDFNKFTRAAGDDFDWRGKRILDVACGRGDLANQLAMQGAAKVVGIDINREAVSIATSAAVRQGLTNVEFIDCDFHDWATTDRFDHVISYQALEHIPDVARTLEKMASLTRDDGRMTIVVGGFWLGPLGADHCDAFMRFRLPWRQLLFGEEALLTVRREKFRPTSPATSFREMGVTKLTLSEYKRAIDDLGLTIVKWQTNYQLRFMLGGLLYSLSLAASRLPRVGEHVVFSTLGIFETRTG